MPHRIFQLSRAIFFLSFIFQILGCSGAVGENWAISVEDRQRLEAVDRVIQNDACEASRPEACEFETVAFTRGNQLPNEGDDVILILDDALAVATAALHESRVLAHFRVSAHFSDSDSTEHYIPYVPEVSFPAGMRKILHQIFKGKESLAASRAAQSVAERFEKKYRGLFGGKLLQGHGTTIFNLLAELNPEAKFVVVHQDERFSPSKICELSERGGEQKLVTFWRERANALAEIARQYRVKWVNYSAGYDLNRARQEWESANCRGERPSQETFARFVMATNAIAETLSQVPGLLFVQAGPDPNGVSGNLVASDFCADCVELPQRLRVGYLNLEEEALAPYQSRNYELLTEGQRQAVPCSDLFVRDGLLESFRPSNHPVNLTATGFSHAPLNVSGTSFAAPIGLSYAAYLMKKYQLGPSQVVKWIRGESNQPLLVSPFSEKQFLNHDPLYVNWLAENYRPR